MNHTPERNKPWQIAADLEAAAMAVKEAWRLINAVAKPAHVEIDLIPHIGALEDIAPDLQGLSDKWQSIADAEEEL